MSLKTAWLNLQDGLGNRFAWSHVNAIYYSQAQNKLLKDKLDDMETAINGKVAKTDIVQVESISQSTVPSSAYLKTVKDALDSDISELNAHKAEAIYVDDLLSVNNKGLFVYYDMQTANTPYKAGITSATQGIAFITGFSGWRTIYCIPNGALKSFIYVVVNDVAYGWYENPYTKAQQI